MRFLIRLSSLATVTAALAVAQNLPQKAYKILKENCFACHGAAKTSGLDLRTRESMLKGGQRGPAVTPSNLNRSLLFTMASHSAEPFMPPGKKLPDADVAILRQWILDGAELTDVETPASSEAQDQKITERVF